MVALRPFAAASASSNPTQDRQTADKVFLNGRIYTMEVEQPWAEAIAISGNRIVYVGDNTGAQAYRGESTEWFDLNKKMVLPGFVSGHDHLVASSWSQSGVNLTGVADMETALEQIGQYAQNNPALPFIRGFARSTRTT